MSKNAACTCEQCSQGYPKLCYRSVNFVGLRNMDSFSWMLVALSVPVVIFLGYGVYVPVTSTLVEEGVGPFVVGCVFGLPAAVATLVVGMRSSTWLGLLEIIGWVCLALLACQLAYILGVFIAIGFGL